MSGSDLDKRTLDLLGQLVIALKYFEGKYNKRLNFSKFAHYLGLNEIDAHLIAQFIIEYQDEFKEFSRIFKKHFLSKKWEGETLYLITKEENNIIPQKITLTREHAGWISDLIYAFQHVKKGKGFNLNNKDADVVKKICLLMNLHPYFFFKNGNNMVYPSKLGSEVGNCLLSYKKLNKYFESLTIEEFRIEITNED